MIVFGVKIKAFLARLLFYLEKIVKNYGRIHLIVGGTVMHLTLEKSVGRK